MTISNDVATDAQMVQWLRLRTDGDDYPSQEQQIAVRLAEKLQANLAAALARVEAAEALAYERLEDMLFAEQRATDADLRAEAAEAEAAEWKTAYADNELYGLALMQRRDELAARVAELEAQLAAQGWRPLDAPPASTGEYLIGADYIPDVLLAEYHADTDMWYQQLPDGEWQLADWATHWRPLPPAPQETTP